MPEMPGEPILVDTLKASDCLIVGGRTGYDDGLPVVPMVAVPTTSRPWVIGWGARASCLIGTNASC